MFYYGEGGGGGGGGGGAPVTHGCHNKDASHMHEAWKLHNSTSITNCAEGK